jgi:uncharacterized protein (TIGR00255 family)
MIRSMTGFGAAEGPLGSGRVSVEIRSVNHRFFNPSIKLPSELSAWEGDVREAVRRAVVRGHVTVSARLDRQESLQIDEARFGAYVEQLRRLQERFGLGEALDMGTVLRLPNVMSSGERQADGSSAELVAVVTAALTALDGMRSSEGARLAEYLLQRLEVISGAVERIAVRAPERVTEQRDRLRAAVVELGGGVLADEQRIAQEIAILADRLDVGEELSRFRSHFAAFRDTLAHPPADGVGKRLGFLVQELLREANTTGSKGSDAAVVADVLVIKEELERIREQVENLE